MPSVNPRKEVTSAIATYLKTPNNGSYLTGAGARVFDNDATPPDADGMNEINVVFVKEDIDPATMHQDGRRRRIMQLQIECYHSGSRDAADDLAWDVENAIRANPTLANKVEWVKLTGLSLFVVENSTYALFSQVMTFEVIYWTHVEPDEEGIPRTVLLGFEPETGPGNEPDYSIIFESDPNG